MHCTVTHPASVSPIALIQQTSVNPDLRQNRIKLVPRVISKVFLYKSSVYPDFLIWIFANTG